MKANGRADSTIERSLDILTRLSKLCDIRNTQKTKLALANLKWKNSTKNTTAGILKCFYKFKNIPFEKPKYTRANGLPFIPTEEELNSLISAGKHRTATRLQLLKETGVRIGEIDFLTWKDIDLKRKIIHITAEKGSNDRILPLSEQMINMLNKLPRNTEKVFQTTKNSFRKTFDALRKRTAKNLCNPRLLSITCHTFRHFKGTMEYHKTNDIYQVKLVLGHKRITSTEKYIHIEASIFLNSSDEWNCKATTKDEEAQKLIEVGFEYVTTTPNELMLFRKRK